MQQILPGSTLGVLGGGQLGRMFSMAAKRMGYRVVVYTDGQDSPAGQVSDCTIVSSYTDEDALSEFSRQVDVVTYEFENIPTKSLQVIEKVCPVRPGELALATAQHRFREKSTVRDQGIPTADFYLVQSLEDLEAAAAKLNHSGILKTVSFGYDGKGQRRITPESDLAQVWAELGQADSILEELIDFDREVSVVGVRGLDGSFCCYGPILNHHENHILDVSVFPCPGLSDQVANEGVEMTRTIMEALEAVGVLCVEFFQTANGLVVNEIAPRPHNSGHLTIEGHATSQFEQQVRTICGLPLGDVSFRPVAMANLLGQHLDGVTATGYSKLFNMPETHLHMYGKGRLAVDRKMGHITAIAEDSSAAEQKVRDARAALKS